MTDKYSKTVLTVIAICLSLIVVKEYNIFPTANAQSRSDISYCWDLAKINKITDRQWEIRTYC